MAGVGGAGGPAEDAAAADLPALPAWQQKELAALQLVGPGANTEVTVRRAAAPSSSSGSAGGPVDPRLLAAVRVLCSPTAQALGGRSGAEQLGRWDVPLVQPAAELAALKTLSGLCAIVLSSFQGSLEDDAQLLKGAAAQQAQQASAEGGPQPAAQLSDDQQLAVRFRMDKKALLLQALSAIAERTQQLAAAATSGAGSGGAGGSKPGQKPKPATSKGFGK